jgi:hypothetical protein
VYLEFYQKENLHLLHIKAIQNDLRLFQNMMISNHNIMKQCWLLRDEEIGHEWKEQKRKITSLVNRLGTSGISS